MKYIGKKESCVKYFIAVGEILRWLCGWSL